MIICAIYVGKRIDMPNQHVDRVGVAMTAPAARTRRRARPAAEEPGTRRDGGHYYSFTHMMQRYPCFAAAPPAPEPAASDAASAPEPARSRWHE